MTETAHYYDIEAYRQSVSKKLWAITLLSAVVAMGALGVAFVSVIKPTPVIAFDSQGKPQVFKDTVAPGLHLNDVRLEHFAMTFLKHFLLVDSTRLAEDYDVALGMMSSRMRDIVANEGVEAKRRAGFKESFLRMVFPIPPTVKIASYEDTTTQFPMLVIGEITLRPIAGDGGGQDSKHWFLTELVARKAPVTQASPHGLLVDFVTTKLFDSKDARRLAMLKKQGVQ